MSAAAIERTIFNADHEAFRDSVAKFFDKEIVPFHAQWEKDGIVPREAWLAAGEQGLLGINLPEEYGGLGLDRRFVITVFEELTRRGLTGLGFGLSSEIVAQYISHHGTEEQKQRWLPAMIRGEKIGAVAMTEPNGGSDLQAIRTTAIRDGDHYVLNGQKTFISNGQMSDLVVVVAKTDPTARARGISLIVVERGMAGFERGRNLEKIGMHAQDTSELYFNDVRVPARNLLGAEGRGFAILMQELAWERMGMAIRCITTAEVAIEQTVTYTRERHAFGRSLLDNQNTRFKLAEHKANVQAVRVFVDKCIELVVENELDSNVAAMAKLVTTELLMKVLDDCLQFHGGYGFMMEYPIGKAWIDNRYTRIAGGSNEVLRDLIGRTL